MDIEAEIDNHQQVSNFFKHGGNIAQEAKRLGFQPNELIDASASLVPFPPPKEIKKCIINALKGMDITSYPDPSLTTLRDVISTWHGIDPSCVLPGNGAAELITWAARDAAKHGLSILPSPGFSDYKRALKCWNSLYKQTPLPLSWDSIFPQSFPISTSSNVIWVTNPHNPTGQLWSRNSLEKLLVSNRLVICDEAFLPLVPNGDKQSLIPLITSHSNLIVIRSLTKLFSIAGLRVGYAISSRHRLHEWEKCRDPWPMNGLAIAVGTMLMSNQTLMNRQIQKVQSWVSNEGAWLHSKLEGLHGIKSYPSSTNFQLIHSSNSLSLLREQLAQRKILLRDCQSFEGLGANWLRISLKSRHENLRILDAMKEVIN
ncbi:pyridoxal phosphate-dependent aminotransferase [Prochlorococcus marinus]|uniref:Aminotransferase n=1 Tax=Prochlorococcus marinus (strain MIT 9211) TaxID=93059 RepID=A9BDG1_PROM4|nr:aminotransferase class I/II-fold pyridoxal phosphate-dependent enzyme [Prochlorococcus marinus]ABX08147.1 Aminotransferase class-I [Prochlorococcus marinus str. MIT 9211]